MPPDNTPLPELNITVFSDYICPFCYLGHHRLFKLNDSYDLKINWCFLEIHPEISANGESIDKLNYEPDQWKKMLNNLRQIASEENIPLEELSFITNSKDALLLAEATKHSGREIFYALHEALFHAYFVEKRNIGDRKQLKKIAKSCGVDEKTIEAAWDNSTYKQRLIDNFNTARKHNVQRVPSFIFGEEALTGIASESNFRKAAKQYLLKDKN